MQFWLLFVFIGIVFSTTAYSPLSADALKSKNKKYSKPSLSPIDENRAYLKRTLSSEDLQRNIVMHDKLVVAVGNGEFEMTKMLLKAGVSLVKPSKSCKCESVIHLAARRNFENILALLLGKAPKRSLIDHKDSSGNTALHLASINGSLNCVKLLLKAGALQLPNNEGHLPHELAKDSRISFLFIENSINKQK